MSREGIQAAENIRQCAPTNALILANALRDVAIPVKGWGLSPEAVEDLRRSILAIADALGKQ